MGLLDYASDVFSQNGEDGVLAELFRRIGTTTSWCCELGAWDGVHLSNTRALILEGWSAVLIEADPGRYTDLVATYRGRDDVICLNATVSAPEPLSVLVGAAPRLDLLSVDVDGLDFEIVTTLDIAAPRVLCVEVNAGHDPMRSDLLPRETAAGNVGQPLRAFVHALAPQGYRLVAYTGNAIFVHEDSTGIDGVTPEAAYAEFVDRLDAEAREWLYLVNLGLVEPHYRYRNALLARRRLEIGALRAAQLRVGSLRARRVRFGRTGARGA